MRVIFEWLNVETGEITHDSPLVIHDRLAITPTHMQWAVLGGGASWPLPNRNSDARGSRVLSRLIIEEGK